VSPSVEHTSPRPSGAVLDPFGRAAGKTEPFTTTTTTGRVQSGEGLTVYGRVGDLFAGLCTLVTLATWWRVARR